MRDSGACVRSLQSHGLRVTKPRLAVLEYLRSTRTHPTAEEIGLAVNQFHPAVSRASIYNVLRVFAAKGLIQELTFEGPAGRFDGNQERHHHFICRSCEGVIDIPDTPGTETLLGLGERGFEVEDVSVTLRGTCPSCSRKDPYPEGIENHC